MDRNTRHIRACGRGQEQRWVIASRCMARGCNTQHCMARDCNIQGCMARGRCSAGLQRACLRTPAVRGVCRGRPGESSSFSSDFAMEGFVQSHVFTASSVTRHQNYRPSDWWRQALHGRVWPKVAGVVGCSNLELNCIQLGSICSRIKR